MSVPDAVRRAGWALRMAALIPEPRVVRAFYFGAYLLMIVQGLSCLIHPLQTWEGTFGLAVTYFWAAIVAFGGVVAASSVFTIYWAVERIGIFFGGGGMLIYFIVTLGLHASGTGNRIPQACVIAIVLLMLALRLLRIRGAIVEPGR